ncbi:hypothetical protein A5642_22040 [Mycolicibacterium mucogenicum]|uniref:DUF4760 domain-containing protein n=1 Tax=Mycolicibacterium mucogenicum TaxID=56689 RepID=A0A1A0MPR2_MYCMU|nr:hypothetical protein [Mycolicibacterium mucogenicum]OBA86763.1 hypothetical protein A5642_22040 [Mycolicibacterium mucogenicum]
MADVTLVNTLLAGIPSMVVAVVGVVGVIYTQKRADARQDRIAEISRRLEHEARVLDAQRQAGAELVTAAWQLAAHSRDVVPEGAGFDDLEPAETAAIYRAHSVMGMLLRPADRPAASAVVAAVIAFVGDFSQEKWDGIEEAELALIAVINREPSTAASRPPRTGRRWRLPRAVSGPPEKEDGRPDTGGH